MLVGRLFLALQNNHRTPIPTTANRISEERRTQHLNDSFLDKSTHYRATNDSYNLDTSSARVATEVLKVLVIKDTYRSDENRSQAESRLYRQVCSVRVAALSIVTPTDLISSRRSMA